MKKLILLFILLGTSSLFADKTPYCIRIYCIKQPTAKIRNAAGHGAFFSALFDSDTNNYYLAPQDFNTIRTSKSCAPYHHPDTQLELLYGKNAATLESIATWVVVKPAPSGINVAANPQCKNMEK